VTKFILRNGLEVAMATIVAASLVAGLAVSLAQTRRAEDAKSAAESQRLIALHETSLAETARLAESRQKDIADLQRDEARHQKAIADQRVKDTLQLANRTLFDVHDAIAVLPGSVSARRTIVKTTLEYLENLEHQAGLDDEMREVLCAAYYKVAMIQGNPQGASLQDFQGAETNLLKGQALLMPAYNRNPNDSGLMLRLIEVRSSLADLMYRSGREEQAIQAYIDLLPVAQRLSLVRPCTLSCETQQVNIENRVALELLSIDAARSLEHANHGIAVGRGLLAQHPDDATSKQDLGSLMAAGAAAYKALGDLEKAGDYYRESIEAREDLLHNDPNNTLIRRNLLIAYGNYAALLGVPWNPNLNRPAEARVYAAKAVALARGTVEADANDVTARHDLGMSLGRLGMVDPAPDGVAESLASLEEARKLIEPIAGANSKSAETANQVALVLEYEGHRQEALVRSDEAIASYLKSIAVLQPFFDQQNEAVTYQYLSSEQSLALLYASIGDHSAALELANRAFAQAEKYSGQLSRPDSRMTIMAEGWSVLAVAQSKAGMVDQARQSAETAMKLWNSITRPGVLSAHRRALADMQTLLMPPRA
jgi:tetratricopeptide (TPR) repeat protein